MERKMVEAVKKKLFCNVNEFVKRWSWEEDTVEKIRLSSCEIKIFMKLLGTTAKL